MSDESPRLADPRPQDFTPQGESFGHMPQPEQALMPAGQTLVQTQGAIISAQRVAVPRDHNRILQRLQMLCGMAGDNYVYSWDVKEKSGRKVPVRGATIKLANDLAREYGNCIVETRVQDFPGYWLFYARFVDIETGFSTTRSFQQRKAQDTGMKDKDRAADIVFQIGQSKAIRNVIVNALTTYADQMVEWADEQLLAKVEKNPDKAHAFIDKVLAHFDIEIQRVEATVGRPRAKWTVRNLAKVYAECRGIADNMTVADDVYPPLDTEKKPAAEPKTDAKPKAEEKEPEKPKAEAKPKETKKAAAKKKAKEPEPKPKSEPEPETEPEGEAIPPTDHQVTDPMDAPQESQESEPAPATEPKAAPKQEAPAGESDDDDFDFDD